MVSRSAPHVGGVSAGPSLSEEVAVGDLVVARRSGVIMHGGRRHTVRRGQTIGRRGHPLVDGHEQMWKPLRVHFDTPVRQRPVETATAVPGEPREVQPAVEVPQRPPTSGRGSGAGAWRQYAAAVTGTPVEQWADKSREQIRVELGDDQSE